MHPSRPQSRRLLSSLSLLFIAFLALIAFSPAVNAEDPHAEYGTVIGIGKYSLYIVVANNRGS